MSTISTVSTVKTSRRIIKYFFRLSYISCFSLLAGLFHASISVDLSPLYQAASIITQLACAVWIVSTTIYLCVNHSVIREWE